MEIMPLKITGKKKMPGEAETSTEQKKKYSAHIVPWYKGEIKYDR